MAESESHKNTRNKALGKNGVNFFKGRLASATGTTAFQIERSLSNLSNSVSDLKGNIRPRKVLQVPQNMMDKAVEEMKKQGVGGTVANMSGTKIHYV